MKRVFVSIVIPIIKINDFLRKETIPALLKQTYQNFEIIIITDKTSKEKFPKTIIIPSWPKTGPADKRDMGVQKAKGEVIAFLDDDSYPDEDWLKKALGIFEKDKKITGVAGPNITPPQNSLRQKASGYVWATWLGSGGAGTYRCAVSPRQEVDDFPTVNLLVRKKDFLAVGGFDSHFWPGEDTVFCHNLVYKLGKKIIYDPAVLVYHHRRSVFKPHLQQIGRYALHRGHFARILPQTSLRLGYLIPSLFVLWLFGGPVLIFLLEVFQLCALSLPLLFLYLLTIGVYLVLLLITGLQIYLKERNWRLAFLSMASIFITHVVYGVLFIKGFFSQKLAR
ncbi:glycosyltransferase [Candidatus Shapirobacteria bacterium]|nr:glycosyltransferase [Candidatus Shapirobacteria bacterium]